MAGLDGGRHYPRWGPGGKELYYIAPDGTLMAAPIAVNGATSSPAGRWRCFITRIYGGGTDLDAGAQLRHVPASAGSCQTDL